MLYCMASHGENPRESFFENILLDFFHTVYYNIENWVWIYWSGPESNCRRHMLHVEGPGFLTKNDSALSLTCKYLRKFETTSK